MSESIEQKLKRQKQHEQEEFLQNIKSAFKLRPKEQQVAYELITFLQQKLPNIQTHEERLHIYRLDEKLQNEFLALLVKKGLAYVYI
jgi:hypothetical protein